MSLRGWACVLVLVGCVPAYGPDYPGYSPPADMVTVSVTEWQPEWEQIKTCSGLSSSPPDAVFLVPRQTETRNLGGFVCDRPYLCWGMYRDHSVYVVKQLGDKLEARIVRHEMLHHILRMDTGSADGDHCSPLWVDDACDVNTGTISCGSVSRGEHDTL